MFPVTLRRPARRVLATVALAALTVAPTVYVGYTAWLIRRPEHLRAVEAEIGRQIGMRVTLKSVRYPRPGDVVFEGVTVLQEEPRGKGPREVARADVVRLRRADRELTLQTRGLRLQGESPRLAMAQLAALLQRSSAAPAFERLNLSAPTCSLSLGRGVPLYQFRDVVGHFLADPVAPAVRASYRVAYEVGSTRCEFALTRDRKAEPVRTTVAFKTMEGLPLPAAVLDPFFDTVDWLGGDARVEGALTLRQDGAKDWEADFQGNLLDVDLAELVARRFPKHRLRGKGRLAVTSARWAERPGQGFGWAAVEGELTAGPGSVGTGLLNALTREMKFRAAPKVDRVVSAGQADLDFRALGFRFAMTGDGQIRVSGALGTEYADDVVLADPNAPLAFAPEGAANVRGLIKTLVPIASADIGELVPLTEKSRLLLCLPVPPDLAAAKPIGGN